MDGLIAILARIEHEIVSVILGCVVTWIGSKVQAKLVLVVKDLNGYFNGLRTLESRVRELEDELKNHISKDEEE